MRREEVLNAAFARTTGERTKRLVTGRNPDLSVAAIAKPTTLDRMPA